MMRRRYDMERLKSSKKRIIGLKQTIKAIKNGSAHTVYIANDVEESIKNSILEVCRGKEVEIVYIDTMKKLGEACGIEVNASCASLLND
jgi:large subunit ribosomal protein L7A